MVGKKLERGAIIGIVAPASYSSIENIISAKNNLENMGFNVVLGECTYKTWYSFAGSDEERAREINSFFADPKIDVIMCMRGGYGCNRIIEKIDFDIIRKNPKIFIGYSDITTLHISMNEKADLITFHGPMAVSNFSGSYNIDTFKNFISTLTGEFDGIVKNIDKDLKVIVPGVATGKIVGGNLATLVSTLGTEYDIDYNNKILFIEEIGEKTYKIDRLLNHLKKHKVFEKINGLILGDFKNCDQDKEDDMNLQEVFNDYFKNLSIPVVCGLQSGHCEPMITLPLGAMCQLDGNTKRIKILEKIVR